MAVKDMTDKQVEDRVVKRATVTVSSETAPHTSARVCFYREDGVMRVAIELRPGTATVVASDILSDSGLEALDRILKRCCIAAREKLGAKEQIP